MDPAATVVRSTPLRLLLIEDDSDGARLIVRELQRSGYAVAWDRVQTATALKAALEQQWDVIACDWDMPALGAAVALTILGEQGVDLPVIIVAAQVTEEMTVTAVRAGAHDVVSKSKLALTRSLVRSRMPLPRPIRQSIPFAASCAPATHR